MKEHFGVLDIFRGIFSSMVVLFHLSTFSNTPIINNPFILNSDLFVDFFFVLSGFVIAYSYQHISNGQQFLKFYKKRFLRLYPLHCVMLLAFVVVEVSKHFLSAYVHVNELNNPDNNSTTFLSSLLLLHSIKMPGIHDVSWNIPSWSISAEMIAYLVFGVLMVIIHRAKAYKWRSGVYLLLLSAVVVIFTWITGWEKLTYSFDWGFLRALMGFFTGVICYNVYSAIKERLRRLPTSFFNIAEATILVLILFSVWHTAWFSHYEYMFEVLFFTCILLFAFEKGFISHTLKKIPLLEKIGRYSYSIYMTHALLLSLFNIVFFRVLKFQPSAYAYLFILNYILIYQASKWTYKNIEMRFSYKKPPQEISIPAPHFSESIKTPTPVIIPSK